MAIEAHLSKYKKQNFWIIIALMFVLGAWFGYDGYFKKSFIEKHTTITDTGEKIPDSDLVFNRKSPPYFFGAGLVAAVCYLLVRNKKIVAGATSLQMGKVEIPYDSIERITKTFFDKKGYFTVTYKDGEKEIDLKLSSRNYDNMQAILDELVKQIS